MKQSAMDCLQSGCRGEWGPWAHWGEEGSRTHWGEEGRKLHWGEEVNRAHWGEEERIGVKGALG